MRSNKPDEQIMTVIERYKFKKKKNFLAFIYKLNFYLCTTYGAEYVRFFFL